MNSAPLSLPLLDERRAALETCGYCPKLCRAACPVSNAEPKDTLTPWGKMSTSWFQQRGLAPADTEHAALAWACTGCLACQERCDHRNPVAATLLDARTDFAALGAAPAAALAVSRSRAEREAELSHAVSELRALPGVQSTAKHALLVGCSYLRHLPEESRAIVQVAAALLGEVSL